MKCQAVAQIADRRLEMVELDVPKIRSTEGLLRVTGCGICGTDVEQYEGALNATGTVTYPLIPGPEPVGVIEEIGSDAARRWGLKVGQCVAIEPLFACGRCSSCTRLDHHLCKQGLEGRWGCYGYMPLTFGSGLWGGFSEYIHLHPDTKLHVVPQGIPQDLATIYQSLASGIRWAVRLPKTAVGDTVLILGSGQRGLAAVVACRAAGASRIIVTGLQRDEFKLQVARALGAHDTIIVDQENTVQRVMEITHGQGVDVAVDTVPFGIQPVIDAIACVRVGGSVVLAGIKGHEAQASIPVDRLIFKEIKLLGVYGQTSLDYIKAMQLLEQMDVDLLSQLRTHRFKLADTAKAIQTLAGQFPDEKVIGISIEPQRGE